DTVHRDGVPGTLYLIEPDLDAIDQSPPSIEPHLLDPWRVLRLARSLGGEIRRVFIVGCQPASLETDDGGMELSEPVQAAVSEAVSMIDSVVTKIRADLLINPRGVATGVSVKGSVSP